MLNRKQLNLEKLTYQKECKEKLERENALNKMKQKNEKYMRRSASRRRESQNRGHSPRLAERSQSPVLSGQRKHRFNAGVVSSKLVAQPVEKIERQKPAQVFNLT